MRRARGPSPSLRPPRCASCKAARRWRAAGGGRKRQGPHVRTCASLHGCDAKVQPPQPGAGRHAPPWRRPRRTGARGPHSSAASPASARPALLGRSSGPGRAWWRWSGLSASWGKLRRAAGLPGPEACACRTNSANRISVQRVRWQIRREQEGQMAGHGILQFCKL